MFHLQVRAECDSPSSNDQQSSPLSQALDDYSVRDRLSRFLSLRPRNTACVVCVHVPCARVVLEEDYAQGRAKATSGRAVEQIAATIDHIVQALAPKTTDLPAKPATTSADVLTVIQLRFDTVAIELRSKFGCSKARSDRVTNSGVDGYGDSGCDGECAVVRLQVHGLRVAKEVFTSGLPTYAASLVDVDTQAQTISAW